jgi:hypothetical protein
MLEHRDFMPQDEDLGVLGASDRTSCLAAWCGATPELPIRNYPIRR